MNNKTPTDLIISNLKQQYLKYKNWIISIVSAVVVTIIVIIFVVSRLQQTKQYFAQRIALAEGYLYQKNFTEAYKILDEIAQHYKNSKYAGYAMYLKASSLYENKDYVSAKQICLDILKIKKPKTIIVPTMYMLGLCYMSLFDFNNAITVFNEIVQKYADSYYTPRVYEILALCYEMMNDIQNAKSVYEKMNILFPNSYWSNIAQQKLTQIK